MDKLNEIIRKNGAIDLNYFYRMSKPNRDEEMHPIEYGFTTSQSQW